MLGADLRAISADQLAAALSDASAPRMVFQPIVDVSRGVVTGYEALARFDAEPYLPPDAWFAAAARFNVAAQLEARAVLAALSTQAALPANCFLTINVSPHLLGSQEIRRALFGRDLRGIVVELTEHVPYGNDPSLLNQIAALREAGAMIALDDAGSGYSGLQQLLAIRPEIIKLDRGLVSGADKDEAKLALVRMLGEFAGQLDSWLLAEGVETAGELAAFAGLGVPLAQGWLLGRPGERWAEIPDEGVVALAAASARADAPSQVAGLAEQVVSVRQPGRFGADWFSETYLSRTQIPGPLPDGEPLVVVDEWDRPEALLLPVTSRPGGPAYRVARPLMRAAPTTSIRNAALRAVARPTAQRFDPIICTDDEGHFVGLVRMERLVARLAGEG